VMDSEAGMEHLSRRTASRLDHLIVVVNRSPLSVDCARRIDAVIASVKNEVRHKWFLINDVPAERVEAVREKASDLDMEYLGYIPRDEAIEETTLKGESLYELGDSIAIAKVKEFMEKLGV